MNILYFVQDLELGGVTSVITSNIYGLESIGNNLLLIVLKPCDIKIIGTKTEVISLNIDNIFNYSLSFVRIKKIIEDFQPDIIHSHQYHSHIIISIFLIFYRKAIPLVANQHGTLNRSQGDGIRWKIFKLLDKSNRYTVNVSQVSVDSYVQEKVFKENKSFVIYNPVNTNFFKPSLSLRDRVRNRLFLDESTFLIGYIGRLSEEKDIFNLIEAINLLKNTYFKNNVNFKVIVVGEGIEKEYLMRKVEELQLTSYIVFLGEQRDVRPYLAAIDVLVLCSKTEGLPTIILEAMSMECLIASTDCGGVREIFYGVPSFLSPVGDSERLANNIFLINQLSESEKIHLAKSYREQIINKFSIPIISKDLYNFYQLVIKKKETLK